MAFFVSIGLLVDLKFVWEHIGTVIVIVFVITVLKTFFIISCAKALPSGCTTLSYWISIFGLFFDICSISM